MAVTHVLSISKGIWDGKSTVLSGVCQETLLGYSKIFLVTTILCITIYRNPIQSNINPFSSPPHTTQRIKYTSTHKKKNAAKQTQVSQSIPLTPACFPCNTTLQIPSCPSCFQIAQQLSRWNSAQRRLSDRWCPRCTNISLSLSANAGSNDSSYHQ